MRQAAGHLSSLLSFDSGPSEERIARRVLWQKRARLSKWVSAVVLIILFILLHNMLGGWLNAFVEWCGGLGWGAPFLLALATGMLTFFMLPSFPMMVGAGVVLPRMWGMFVGQFTAIMAVMSGLWAGSMLAFVLGRTLMRKWAEERLNKLAWMRVINSMVADEGWWVVMLARMSPLLPAEIFNYACSLTPISFTGFALGSLGSVVPVCVWVMISASASQGIDPSNFNKNLYTRCIMIGLNVIFLLFISFIFYRSFRRYQEKEKRHVNLLMSGLTVNLDEEQQTEMHKMLTHSVRRLERDPGLIHHQIVNRFQSNNVGNFIGVESALT